MRNVLHWRQIAIVLGLCAVLVAACGDADEEDVTSPDDGDPEEEVESTPTSDDGEPEPGGDELVIDGEVIAEADLYAAAQEEGGLTVYQVTGERPLGEIAEEFTSHTGIEVEHVRLPSARLYERIMTEFAADRLAADIVDNTDRELMQDMLDEGVYAPHRVIQADDIPEDFIHPEGYWVNWTVSSFGIVYNTVLTEELGVEITSWRDFTDPRLENNVGIVAAPVGGTAWITAYFMREQFGLEYWEALADQSPALRPTAASVLEEVSRGELVAGVTSVHNTRFAQREGAPVEIAFPEGEGFPGGANYTGLSSTAENPNAAKVWLNYLTSRPGAQFSQDILLTYLPNERLERDPDLPGPDDIYVKAFLDDEIMEVRDEWVQEWAELFEYEEEASD